MIVRLLLIITLMIVYFYSGYQICNANTIKIQEKKNNKYYEEKYNLFTTVAAGAVAGELGGDLIGDAMGKSSKKSDGLFNDTFTSVIFDSTIPGGVKYNCLTSSAVMVLL